MRGSFLVLLIQLFIKCWSFSQWQDQVSGTDASLWDVCFLDSLYGWAAGDSGTVIGTTDGGQNWLQRLKLGDSVELRQVEFLNRESGFVAGNIITRFPTYEARRVLLLQTTDGGNNWQRCDSTLGADLTFADMQFITSSYGWICLNNLGQISWLDRRGVLLTTRDSGHSWSIREEIAGLLVGAVCFYDDSIGYSFWSLSIDNNDDTQVHITRDAGTSWTTNGVIREDVVKRAACLSPETVWTIGFGVARSIDFGETWQTWNWFSPVHAGEMRFVPADLEVFNPTNVWLVGTGSYDNPLDYTGVLRRTKNSGEAWSTELQLPYRSFTGLSALSTKEAWIVGTSGLIMHLIDTLTSIREDNSVSFTHTFEVGLAYPTPLSPERDRTGAKIRFSLQIPQEVNVTVHDILGRVVKVVSSGFMNVGTHEILWDGTGLSGEFVPSGVYFFRLQARGSAVDRKMLVVH